MPTHSENFGYVIAESLACGTPDEIVTFKLEEDDGRDKNLEHATKKAMQMFYDFLNEHMPVVEEEG